MGRLKCPIMSAGFDSVEYCAESSCAWWDNKSNCCIVHALSELLNLRG